MKKVLVVEECEFGPTALRETLLSNGFDVLEAVSALDAICVYREHHPDYVILDLFLHETDGLDLIRDLLVEFPNAHFLAMCGRPVAPDVLHLTHHLRKEQIVPRPDTTEQARVVLERLAAA